MAGPEVAGHALTVYLHGIPGSPAELALFGGSAPAEWLVPDRNDPAFGASIDQRLDYLVRLINAKEAAGPIRLIGFSLGAMIGLRLADRLGERVIRVDLVSPAAPLELGNFLPRMAGGPMFNLAGKRPGVFATLAHVQALLARVAPRFLARQLCASAQGEDAVLAGTSQFQTAMTAMLHNGLGRSSQAYRSEIAAYVRPWAEAMRHVRAPMTIWQGEGDNWTPPDMAECLAQQLSGSIELQRLAGLSHYSALRHFLAQSGR